MCGHYCLFAASNNSTDLPVTDICLGCICEASSGCDRSLKCSGDVCGLFRITWAYWSDGGKPTQQGEAPDSPNAYANCANEPFCAARIIQGYMKRFGQGIRKKSFNFQLDYTL
jgi:Destabilase